MLLCDTQKNNINFSSQIDLLAEFKMKLPTLKDAAKYVKRRMTGQAVKEVGKMGNKAASQQAKTLLTQKYPATTQAIRNFPKAGKAQESIIDASQSWMKPTAQSKAPTKTGTLQNPEVKSTPTLRQAIESFGPEGKAVIKMMQTKKPPTIRQLATSGMKQAKSLNPLKPKQFREVVERGKGRQQIGSAYLKDTGYAPTLHQQFAKLGGDELMMNLGPGVAGQIGGGVVGGAVGGPMGAFLGAKGGETLGVSGVRFLKDTLPPMQKGFQGIDWSGKTPGQKILATPGALKQGLQNVSKTFDPTEYRRDFLGPWIAEGTGRVPGINKIPFAQAISAIGQTGPIDDMLMKQAKGLGKGGVNPIPKVQEIGGAGAEAAKKIANIFQPYLHSGKVKKGLAGWQEGRKVMGRALNYIPDFDKYADLPVTDPRVQMSLDRLGTYLRRANRMADQRMG